MFQLTLLHKIELMHFYLPDMFAYKLFC